MHVTQMGTVVEGATDFYGSRLTKAERKATLTEQLLADRDITAARKKRHAKLQEEAQRWAHRGKKQRGGGGGGTPRACKNAKHISR